MPSYESSVTIAAEPSAVWCVLSDVSAWPEWLPTVAKVEPLDAKKLSLGSRFVVHQPKLRPATWKVTELDPPHHFAWVARSLGVEMRAEHTVSQGSGVASRVVLRFTFAGVLGGVLGRLFRSVTESYLAQEAASLKQKVEAPR
jgi:uncharacterized membrane protein